MVIGDAIMIKKINTKYNFKEDRLSVIREVSIWREVINELDDIEYFRRQLLTGLRIPDEFLRGGLAQGELGIIMAPPARGGTNPCWEIPLTEDNI